MELIIGRSPTLTVLHSVESHIISHQVKVGWESGIFFHCCYSICIFKKNQNQLTCKLDFCLPADDSPECVGGNALIHSPVIDDMRVTDQQVPLYKAVV